MPKPDEAGCDCSGTGDGKKKKKKKKPKDREVCYRGSYREYKKGTSKKRLKEVPCEPQPRKKPRK
jgi:hypothetical protein